MSYDWKQAYAAKQLEHMLKSPCRGEDKCFDCWLHDMHQTSRRDEFSAKCREAARAPRGTQWW